MRTAKSSSKFFSHHRAGVLSYGRPGHAIAGAARYRERPLHAVIDGRWRASPRHPHWCGLDLQQFGCRLGRYAVPDERAAMDAEIGRLQADSDEKLKADLASREPTVPGKIDDPLPKSDSLKKSEPKVADGERKIEIPLPSDRDMDRMMSFLERAWRRLIEMANRVQRDVNGKI